MTGEHEHERGDRTDDDSATALVRATSAGPVRREPTEDKALAMGCALFDAITAERDLRADAAGLVFFPADDSAEWHAAPYLPVGRTALSSALPSRSRPRPGDAALLWGQCASH